MNVLHKTIWYIIEYYDVTNSIWVRYNGAQFMSAAKAKLYIDRHVRPRHDRHHKFRVMPENEART